MSDLKKCNKCMVLKDRLSFYSVIRMNDGLMGCCKACHNDYTIALRAENREAYRSYSRDYYIKNKERMKEQAKNWSSHHKDKTSQYHRDYYIKNKEKINAQAQEWQYNNKEKTREFAKKTRMKYKKERSEKSLKTRNEDTQTKNVLLILNTKQGE